MGYEVERFTETVNDGLLCCICRDVLENPVQAPCEHAFCKECIHRWLLCDTKCPEDRKSLTTCQLRPLHRYMKNDLMKLNIKCRHFSLGCHHISTLDTLTSHEERCDYDRIECPNEGCNRKVDRRGLADHRKYCQFSLEECPKGCGVSYTASQRSNHNCIPALRSVMEALKLDVTSKTNEQNTEIDLRLSMQRSHLVQRETIIESEIDQLRLENQKLNSKVKLLLEIGAQREKEIDKLQTDMKEMAVALKALQTEKVTNVCFNQNCYTKGRQPKVTEL